MTREQWLNVLVVKLRPMFKAAGAPLPERVRMSCGWPSSRALAATGKSRTIGQCWPVQCSADATPEIFVSPCLSDAAAVAAVVVHELVHASDNCESGHGAAFRRVALALGLEGKMTATVAGPELAAKLAKLTAEIAGEYPHAELDRAKSGIKKQGTRMIKVVCPACDYTVRTTRTWLNVGVPTCVCGEEMAES